MGPWDDRVINSFGGIQLAGAHFGGSNALRTTVANAWSKCSPRCTMECDRDNEMSARLCAAIGELLDIATLPCDLSEQIRSDALSIGCTVGRMCPSARELELALEIIGENTCARWHMDKFVGRAIVSYTGAVGTEYAHDSNVDMWELQNGGHNTRIIRDTGQIEAVGVGDILFIKGSEYPHGKAGLVHKSPEKRQHDDGSIVNRLLLKVDVHA